MIRPIASFLLLMARFVLLPPFQFQFNSPRLPGILPEILPGIIPGILPGSPTAGLVKDSPRDSSRDCPRDSSKEFPRTPGEVLQGFLWIPERYLGCDINIMRWIFARILKDSQRFSKILARFFWD